MLFPAAFLIMLVLGSIAIDAGAVFLHQRDLAAAAGAAVNDATTIGIDLDQLREHGTTALDPRLVEAAVLASLDRRGVLDELAERPQIDVIGAGQVEVTLVSHADYVIAPALPRGPAGRLVTVTVRSTTVMDS